MRDWKNGGANRASRSSGDRIGAAPYKALPQQRLRLLHREASPISGIFDMSRGGG